MGGKCHQLIYDIGLTVSEDDIPDNQRRAQSDSAPKYHLRCAPSLGCAFQLLVALSDIRVCRRSIRDELADVILLRSKMRNECLLQRGYLQQGLLRVSGVI
jgi:hypothetical protein